MIFINRNQELKIIKEARKSAKTKLYSLLVSGNRRIGKTRLVLQTFKPGDLYFFVNKDNLSFQLLKEYEEILKFKNILNDLETFKSWEDFLSVIFGRVAGMVVFDEFQNFREVDPSIYGLFQKYIDLNETRKNLFLVFLGSNVSLVKKTFEDKKSPLYGRIKRKLVLKPLKLRDIIKFCRYLRIKRAEDIIILYSVFGGYPKYYVSIEDERLQGKNAMAILDRFFLQDNALLEDEVMNILSLEFGKRKGIYYEILSAVASGNTQLKDIAPFLNRKQASISRQFNELLNYFDIIDFETQILGKRKIYFIRHPLINFWFRFFYRNLSYYNQRLPLFLRNFKAQFNTFLGSRFEEICRELLEDMNVGVLRRKAVRLPFFMERIGKQWGHIRENTMRKDYEIDIMGINEKEKKILAGECKWRKNVNPGRIMRQLKDKVSLVNWHNKQRKAYFLIFARSFAFKIKEAICVDLSKIVIRNRSSKNGFKVC